jgi:hypothetical protein
MMAGWLAGWLATLAGYARWLGENACRMAVMMMSCLCWLARYAGCLAMLAAWLYMLDMLA